MQFGLVRKKVTTLAPQLLCFGHDEMLLKTRKWLLEKYVHVELTREWSDLSAFLQNQACDLAILCHTLQSEERQNAIDLLTTSCPKIKIICLVRISGEPVRGLAKDACILTDSSARALVSTVTSILEPSGTGFQG